MVVKPSDGINWDQARTAAAGTTVDGMQGYLATITSAAENDFLKSLVQSAGSPAAWIGASDAEHEGTWKWVSGPEAGTTFFVDDANGGYTVAGQYSSWDLTQTYEPNDPGSWGEDAAVFGFPSQGGPGLWHDAPAEHTSGYAYIVEFGNSVIA